MQSNKELADLIRKDTGHNLVTCGQCGLVILHKVGDTSLVCEECGYEGCPCYFPDLLY